MALYLGNQKVSLRSGQDPTFDYGFDSNGRLVFANKNATEITNFLNYDSSYSEILDLSNLSKMEKVAVNGTVDRKMEGLKGLLVSPNAPFTGTSPQINVSYTGLSKSALVSLFESVPYNVGYTKVGNPTIVDGVASNFSANNGILPTSKLPLANANIDIEIAINANTISNNAQQRAFSCGRFYIRSLRHDPTWNIYFGEDASTVYMGLVSTYPYIKIIRTSGIWYCYRSSNGSSYEQVGTPTAGAALETSLCSIGGGHSSAWAGSVNLNNFYIKVNNVPWFGPGATKNLVPDGTVVGDVTVKDGIASGFSGSDYLKINTTSIVPDLLEFAGKFTMGPNGEGGYIFNNFSVSNGLSLTVRPTSSSNQGMLLYAGTSHYVFYRNRFEAGTTHTYKVLHNKSSGICELYVNDVLVRTLNTSEYTVNFGYNIYIGNYGTDGFGGSIDLNNTYIKAGSDYFYRGMVPITKTCSIVGATGTADLTQEDKNIILNKGWSLTVQ